MIGRPGTVLDEDARMASASTPDPRRVSADLERWLGAGDDATLGSLIRLFGQKSFALVFVLLLGVPALPAVRHTSSNWSRSSWRLN